MFKLKTGQLEASVMETNEDNRSISSGRESRKMEPIVISGFSGRFPESSSVEEFAQNLFGGVDMITEDNRRWTPGSFGLPTRSGKLKDLDQFDADYFSIHAKQADFMDPELRMLLEVTHEAIIDSGVNPQEIRGQNVGVFIGAIGSDSQRKWLESTDTKHGYTLTGCERTMLSNRLSFAFDFKGPSVTLDTACSSSLMALEQACAALKLGHCDAAIVGGVHLCLDPKMSLQFHKLNMLSPQGKCQSFDAAGDGYVRSEAVVAIFIQRKHISRRYYASILAVKTNSDGHKTEGVTFPSGHMQKALLNQVYKEAGVDPRDVVYVEAHGTGTLAGDPQELNAIAEVFCTGRNEKNPLLIGSVKSNMGHSEPASGLCGIAKVLLAMQRGTIPANLHYKTPNPKINALLNGQLKVVAENTEWDGGIVGINSFGFGGANVHVILQSNTNRSLAIDEQFSMEVPFLIPFSGRSKDSVVSALKEISTRKKLNQEMRLLHKIHSKNIPGTQFRGFAIVPKNQAEMEIFVQEIQSQSETPKVWYIFNGMGSQWAEMGKSLMKFQTCKKSLENLAAILKTKNLDLLDILTNGKEANFDNVLISFVCIAAVQIALVDLLSSLKIKPDGIIGHSVGELGAAYADNCLKAEQVIFTAHARGQAILELGPGDGAMAAVGLSWAEAKKKCPSGIYPACHNSKDSVTVSGPAKLIHDFVDQLQQEGIFARKVNSSNQAFHSKYIQPAKLKFKESLDKIIPAPTPRSSRWISSSIPESQWNSDLSKTSSACYHVNNLISPVLFQEALEKVPPSSVVIEIGPHCLLQAILKRSLSNCSHVGLLHKNHKDNSIFLCQSIGKMFNFGLNPLLSNLYPEVGFPVPLETASLSSVVSKCWDHSKSWNVPSFSSASSSGSNIDKNGSGGLNFEISLDKEEDAFYAGHKIDGRIIFPQTGLIVLAWKTWTQIHHGNVAFDKIPFTIENLVVSRATLIPKQGEAALNFNVSITKSTGDFRIEENKFAVASGTIRSPMADDFFSVDPIPIREGNSPEIFLNQQDFYKFMRLRGYEYSGVFQGVKRAGLNLDWTQVEFSNWAAFLDALLHPLVGYHGRHGGAKSLLLPTRLKRISVDPQMFFKHLKTVKDLEKSRNGIISTFHYPNIQLLCCEGVQIEGQKLEPAPRNQQDLKFPVLEKYQFAPHFDDPNSKTSLKNTDDHCLQTCIGLVLENLPGDELNILEISQNLENIISPFVSKFCHSQPKKTVEAAVTFSDVSKQEEIQVLLENSGINVILKESEAAAILKDSKTEENRNLLIVHKVEDLKDLVQDEKIGMGIFVLLRVENSSDEFRREIQRLKQVHFPTLSHKTSHNFEYCLFRKLPKHQSADNQNISSNVIIDISGNSSCFDLNFDWVEHLKAEMRKATTEKIEEGFRINVISRSFDSDNFVPSGILGLVNSLRREPGGQALRCFFINDPNSPAFDFQQPDPELEKLIQRDLLMNVFQNSVWGSFRYFPLPPQTSKKVGDAYLNFQKRGDLSSFQWFQSPLKYSRKEDLCSVYYSALNFRDVMLASGKLNPGSLPNNLGNSDCVLGMEFSGLDSTGKRVMGILPAKAMATSVIPDPGFLWEIPDNWSMADGATVPVAYATAYYALCVRGRLKYGESVLIHGGAGAVGLAAISIALSKNCRVFTTVGSKEKREFLKSTFHQLEDSSFANSRDASFLQHILNETNGRGVDLVLNSLAGDKLLASIDCIAQHGRFLELGKVDLFNDTKLGMSIFLKNASFSGILLDSLTSGNIDQKKVWNLVQNGIDSGVVQPLKSTLFSDSAVEIEKAFRFMASGKHIGKILIQIRAEDEKSMEKIIKAIPRTYFDPSKCYIILGGLGGFGLELCDWMIGRGATKLMLVSRSGVLTGYQKLCLNRWTKSGAVSVVTCQVDATTFEGATEILKQTIENFNSAAIGGIFNLAMVLRDGVLENQTPANFETVAKPKINASMAMDKASRILAPELEHFVCFSSVVSERGAPGLSAYAFANSALERICENRRRDGFPGLTIMWGVVGDVGVLVDQFNFNEEDSLEGTAPQRITSCLNTLDIFLQASASASAHQKVKGREEENSFTLSSFVLAPKSQAVLAAETMDTTNWVESIARILGLETAEELEKLPNKPFHAFGMDSIMTTEVQQFIQIIFAHTITSADVQNLSLAKLAELMPGGSSETPNRTKKSPATENLKDLEDLEKTASSIRGKEKGLKADLVPSLRCRISESEVQKSSELEAETRKKPTAPASFGPVQEHEYLRQFLAYLFSTCSLILIYLILSPISFIIQLSIKMYIWLFQDKTKIKFMDGVGGSMFVLENITSVHILKFQGQPNRDKIINLLEERLFTCQTEANLNSDSHTSTRKEISEPFEKLTWSIEQGWLFCYWRKDESFDLSRHVIFEQVSTSDLDSEMPRLADYYNKLKWNENKSWKSVRPAWEFRIVYSEKAREFLLVFSWNHAYGDGMSGIRLLQQLITKPRSAASVSKPIKKDPSSPVKPPTFFETVSHCVAKTRQIFHESRQLIHIFAQLLLKTWDARKSTFPLTSQPHAASAFAKFPLSKLKSVANSESGHRFNLNAVVLTLCAQVCRRIAKEGKAMRKSGTGTGTETGGEYENALLPGVTWAPFLNSHSSLVNDSITMPIKIPVTDGQAVEEALRMTEKELARTGKREKVLLVRELDQKVSDLCLPFLRILYKTSCRYSFLYTNVFAIWPKTKTPALGLGPELGEEYKFMDMYGFLQPGPFTLVAITDSVNDSLNITLTVSHTILKHISPQFHQLFFSYFAHEMNQL